jgi:pSer/pThr/pTyr-binding forkhead associated (FHA) protein
MLKIAVVNGTANRKAYAFREPTILIGRTIEAVNGRHVRRNQVAFDNDNSTVSRGHARVKYETARPGYRVLDDGSARGTWIVRGGASIPVPHDPRGVRIQSGDEIHLGNAVLRVTIEAS